MVVTARSAVRLIEKHGALLVYPIHNREAPRSLWSEFHPGVAMRWDWDQSGDDRVVTLWHLRAKLAASGDVVYVKWFGGRATFFSRELFTSMLAVMRGVGNPERGLGRESRAILDALELDSPVSSKALRQAVGLQGRMLESTWTRSMRGLWTRLLIVGFGEVDDGAFPSLAVGATKTLFEDLWTETEALDASRAMATVDSFLPPKSPFGKQWAKDLAQCREARETEPAVVATKRDAFTFDEVAKGPRRVR